MDQLERCIKNSLFNSAFETGVRTLIILNEAYPVSYDLEQLTLMDYLVIHSEVVGGPTSLHPNLPHQKGELAIRREIIEQGITLMINLGFLDVDFNQNGVFYHSTDDAYPIVKLMNSTYINDLKSRAKWLVLTTNHISKEKVDDFISVCPDLWGFEKTLISLIDNNYE